MNFDSQINFTVIIVSPQRGSGQHSTYTVRSFSADGAVAKVTERMDARLRSEYAGRTALVSDGSFTAEYVLDAPIPVLTARKV